MGYIWKINIQSVNLQWRKMNYENWWIVMQPVIIFVLYLFFKDFFNEQQKVKMANVKN